MASSTLSLTYEDERAMREIAFKWSIAWDKKDLQTFLSIAASEFTPDYSDFAAVNTKPQACAPEQFFTGAFRREGLGHPDCTFFIPPFFTNIHIYRERYIYWLFYLHILIRISQ
jgi:hypothetical protein